MMKKTIILLTISLLVSNMSLMAHGVNVETSFKDGVVVVISSYSPSQPLINASVVIYSPSDRENGWQAGNTDRTGHFAFVPDVEGEWIFVVDDRKGHRNSTTIAVLFDIPEQDEVTQDEIVQPAEPSESRPSNLPKIITGLSLIFGITGIFYGLKARQGLKSK